jgi:WD40 repeat protein
MSWDPVIATIKSPLGVGKTVWSPCSRFLATGVPNATGEIQILDAITLKQLKSFACPEDFTQVLAFSPDGRLLMWLGSKSEVFVGWDLQTGVPVSKIPIKRRRSSRLAYSITYSGCGTMFAILFYGPTIAIYNILSSTPIYYPPIEGPVIRKIWTHGECVRFATMGLESITVWEVGFTSKHPLREVESLPTPNGFYLSEECIFLPTLSRFAFIHEKTVLVWDAQHSKLLLNSMEVKTPSKMTFSPDGSFFACATHGPEIYLWKESPTGYILHQKLISKSIEVDTPYRPLFSPNGQLVVVSCRLTLESWHTMDSTTSPSCQGNPCTLQLQTD